MGRGFRLPALSRSLSLGLLSLNMCEQGKERNGEGLLWCAGKQRGEGEKEEEKEKKREKERGSDVRERREERKKRRKEKKEEEDRGHVARPEGGGEIS
jgi:hypothetical protein